MYKKIIFLKHSKLLFLFKMYVFSYAIYLKFANFLRIIDAYGGGA